MAKKIKKKGFQVTKEVMYLLGEAGAPLEECARIYLRNASAQERNEHNQALVEGMGEGRRLNTAVANRDMFDKLFKRVENLFDGEIEITSAAEIPDENKCDICTRHMNRSEVIEVKNF